MSKILWHWDITEGSVWPEKDETSFPIFSLPVGGIWKMITVEIDVENVDTFRERYDLALKKLEETLGRSDFHIWYWTMEEVK